MAKFSGKAVDLVLLDSWRKQAYDEQVQWHESNGHFKTQADRITFKAAFDHGWRQCLTTLRTQGFLSCGAAS
jgi:hypothetical protein